MNNPCAIELDGKPSEEESPDCGPMEVACAEPVGVAGASDEDKDKGSSASGKRSIEEDGEEQPLKKQKNTQEGHKRPKITPKRSANYELCQQWCVLCQDPYSAAPMSDGYGTYILRNLFVIWGILQGYHGTTSVLRKSLLWSLSLMSPLFSKSAEKLCKCYEKMSNMQV